MKRDLTADEFKEAGKSSKIIDVRTPSEFESGHISGAHHIDISSPTFMSELQNLKRDESYVLYCRSGSRSDLAVQVMEQMGFDRVAHLDRGLLDWDEHLEAGA